MPTDFLSRSRRSAAIGWGAMSAGTSTPTSGKCSGRAQERAIRSSSGSTARSTTHCCSAASAWWARTVTAWPAGVTLPAGERSWELTPNASWRDAPHRLVVDTTLEDLAGNSVARVFDRDIDDPAHTPIAEREVAVEFRPTGQRTVGVERRDPNWSK